MNTKNAQPQQAAAPADTKAKATPKAEPEKTTKVTKPRDPKDRKAWKRQRAVELGIVDKPDDAIIA